MKTMLLLTLLQLGANGADAYTTAHDMGRRRFQEHNPVAQPFTQHGAPVFALSFGAATAGQFYLEHRIHNNKLRTAVAVAFIAGHAAGAAYSVHEGRR